MVAFHRHSPFPFVPEPPPPPWAFSDAFVYADGNLTGQGGWTGSPSLQILSNTLRKGAGGSRGDHAIDGGDLGLGFFITWVMQWDATSTSQDLQVLLNDRASALVCYFDLTISGSSLLVEVDSPTAFQTATVAAPTLSTPHTYTLTVDTAGNVDVTQDGVSIMSGVIAGWSGAIPATCEVQIINGTNNGTRVFSLTMGQT